MAAGKRCMGSHKEGYGPKGDNARNGDTEFDWEINGISRTPTEQNNRLTWTREGVKTDRRMMPGKDGRRWSACTKRVTLDVKSMGIIGARDIKDIKGREKIRQFKSGKRHVRMTFHCDPAKDARPRQWQRGTCAHVGW